MLGWVGMVCLAIVGLGFVTGQFPADSGHIGPLQDMETTSTIPDARPLSPDSAAAQLPPKLFTASYADITATYNGSTQLVTLRRPHDPHPLVQFAFPNDKFSAMKFSSDGTNILITERDKSVVRWNIAQQQFQ